MIVFGKRREFRDGFTVIRELSAALEASGTAGGRGPRHDGRDALLIATGQLTQGLLDLEFERCGADEDSVLTRACGRLMRYVGDLFVHDVQTDQAVGTLRAALSAVRTMIVERPELQRPLAINEPEGFAFYALLPQQYVASARKLAAVLARDAPADPQPCGLFQVIGIRSIGTALAAVCAAALETPLPIWTVRPSAHPFAREAWIAPSLRHTLLASAGSKTFVVVDEGPGLSGSSFLAVTSWLERHGVEDRRIWLIPSHGGVPGFVAQEQARSRYLQTQRVHVSFEELCCTPRCPLPLQTLFTDLVGSADAPLVDAGAGRWRSQLFVNEDAYPVAHPQQERRKYLLEASGQRWLLKFEGLGERGVSALARARVLHEEGFIPETLALRRGFSLTRWIDGARPLPRFEAERAMLVDRIAAYISCLARRFGNMPPSSGARPAELAVMTRHNACEVLTPELGSLAARTHAWLPELEGLHRTTATDNRMEAHEWLLVEDGKLLKTDALNHHAAHDCIGCQDPAWDIVGACFELDFSERERERLQGSPMMQALWPSARQWTFYELAYLAFKAGFYALAKTMLATSYPSELPRIEAALRRYKEALALRLTALASE